MSPSLVRGLAALEIGVPDLDAAIAFYRDVWGLTEVERSADACYMRATGADYYVLALHRQATPSFVRVSLTAADRSAVDVLAGQVKRSGSTHVTAPGPLSAPGGGYGFTFYDPDGREWVILSDAKRHAGATHASDRPFRLSHVVFNSRDVDGATRFLGDALGFRLRDRTRKASFMGCNSDHHSIAFSDRPNAALSHVAFELPNLDAVLRGCGRLKKAGLHLQWGVGRHGTGDNVFAYFVDPNGFAIEYTAEMQQVDDATYVLGTPETIMRAAHSDMFGLADPPTELFLKALQGHPVPDEKAVEGKQQ